MQRLKAYLPVLLWMALIFAGSTDLGSSQRTSRIIGPFLRWFNPDVTDETIRAVQAVVRKGAHVAVYGILAMLTWRARRVSTAVQPPAHSWNWGEAAGIVLFCGFYAITDELHQSFVSTRQGSPWDVLLDSFGSFCALLLIWLIGRWKGRW